MILFLSLHLQFGKNCIASACLTVKCHYVMYHVQRLCGYTYLIKVKSVYVKCIKCLQKLKFPLSGQRRIKLPFDSLLLFLFPVVQKWERIDKTLVEGECI